MRHKTDNVFTIITFIVQLSSLFGLSGMLPSRYTQASAVGMSFASITSSLGRAVTKLSFTEERYGAIAFLGFGIIMILIGIVCQVILWSSEFVKYYVKRATVSGVSVSENELPCDDIEMVPTDVQVERDDKIELVPEVKFENKTRTAQLKS